MTTINYAVVETNKTLQQTNYGPDSYPVLKATPRQIKNKQQIKGISL